MQRIENSFTQFAAHNTGDNSATLTGKGTFCGMALFALTTNKSNHEIKRVTLRRLLTLTKSDKLITGKRIPIKTYSHPPNLGMDSMIF